MEYENIVIIPIGNEVYIKGKIESINVELSKINNQPETIYKIRLNDNEKTTVDVKAYQIEEPNSLTRFTSRELIEEFNRRNNTNIDFRQGPVSIV